MNMNEMNCLTLRNGIIEVTGFKEALQFLTICYHEPGLYIFPDRKSDNDNAIICDLEDRRFRIGINGHDALRSIHTRGKLYRSGNATGNDQFRAYGSST